MINTIFYFPESLTFEDYTNLFTSGEISKNTIVFAKEQRAIYMGGDNYTGKEVTPVSNVKIYVGSGSTYETVNFSDTGKYLTDKVEIDINKNNGDYIFIKIDKDGTIRNLCTHTQGIEGFDYPVQLDDAVVDGDYKYYKSSSQMNAGTTHYRINNPNIS